MSGDASSLFIALSNFGAFGILVAFLIWKDLRADAARIKFKSEHEAEQLVAHERRLTYDRDRLETDKAIAAAIAGLNATIQSRWGS